MKLSIHKSFLVQENEVSLALEVFGLDTVMGHQWLRPISENCQSDQGSGCLPSRGTIAYILAQGDS